MVRTYNQNGDRVRRRQRAMTFIDLTLAPRFNDKLPDDVMFSMVVIPAADGQPMIALVNPTLMATTKDVLDRISAARQQFVDDGVARDATQQTLIDQNTQMLTQLNLLIAQLQARKTVVNFPDVTIPASSLITLTLGEKTFNIPVSGIKTTDIAVLTPKDQPANYGLRGWSIPSDGNVQIREQCPILSVGGSPLTFSLVAFR